MGGWAVGTMQWRLNKITLRPHQRNWDQGWLQFQPREETAKLWVREGVQALGIAVPPPAESPHVSPPPRGEAAHVGSRHVATYGGLGICRPGHLPCLPVSVLRSRQTFPALAMLPGQGRTHSLIRHLPSHGGVQGIKSPKKHIPLWRNYAIQPIALYLSDRK